MGTRITKEVRLEIKNLRETQKKMEQMVKDLRGTPFLQAVRKATLIVERGAKINAPVDTGRLRASITPQVTQRDKVVRGIVGSNVKYAPYQEARKSYLRRALVDNAQRIYEIIKNVTWEIVRE